MNIDILYLWSVVRLLLIIMSNQNQEELKAIFNLFENQMNEEIDIKQINHVIKQIDELNYKNKIKSNGAINGNFLH